MVTRADYSAEAAAAARSVLIELIHILGRYRDMMVLVGGWIPELLFPHPLSPHTGSLDIDLALDHRQLTDEGYRSIGELLLSRGYRQGKQPFIFERSVPVSDREIVVEIDLLAGEYGGTGRGHRHQRVQDLRVRKARGVDLALDMTVEIELHGELPEGGRDSVTLRVASIVPFLIMKAIALSERLKEKDAWDIWFCLRNHPGGMDALAEVFRPHLGHGLVREGLLKLAEKFASTGHVGPTMIADFEMVRDGEERALIQRDAFERVEYLLRRLGIT
ncbi:MAG: nucleotidyl transferase AbiEii/AbiGii toxin family protein [Candidatus Methylomirabilia bacterium]